MGVTEFVLELLVLKAKLKVFLTEFAVSMVTGYEKKVNKTCSPIPLERLGIRL